MKRRALSTVVGAAFFVIVMASTISYVAYSMDLIDNLARSVDTKQDENLNRQNEEFGVTGVTITSQNKFDVAIENSGSIPIKITRVYVKNSTDPLWNVTKYDIDTEIAPGEKKTGIVSNQPLTYVDTESYTMNFVTDRGNIETVSLSSGGNQYIHTNLYALPDVVPTEFNTVLLYEVVNNSTGQLVNLQPLVNTTTICVTCTAVAQENWEPLIIPSLKPGEVGSFQRAYKLTGQDGDLVSFNASLVNAFEGVWDEELVKIQIVKESEEAGVSITAQGIGEASTFSNDVLVLHQETLTIPNGWGQMYSGKADGGTNGDVFEPDKTSHHSWFTNNGTDNITILQDNWDFVLHYRSDDLPPTFTGGNQDADLIYHFETTNFPTSIVNSQGDSSRDLRPCNSGLNSPDIGTGINSTIAYDFVASNNDCLESSNTVSQGDKNAIGGEPDSTSLWFKTNGQIGSADQRLFEWSSTNGQEFYRLSLADNNPSTDRGKLLFEADMGNVDVTCMSQNQYDDSSWHHVSVVRYDADPGGGPQDVNMACKMYIDRQLNQTSCSPTCNDEIVSASSGTGDDDVSAQGRWVVGSNYAQTGNYFNGVIEDLIHWNSYALTEQQTIDVAKTSYGDGAHSVQLTMLETNVDGVKQGGPLYNTATHTIPFSDSFGGGINDDSVYGYYNTTMLGVKDLIIDSGNRVNFTVTAAPATETNLPLNLDIKFDDEGLITPFPTSIHAPQVPEPPFPGFNVLDRDDGLKFNFNNGGVRGFFFTYAGTRLALNATTTTCLTLQAAGDPCVYGAIPEYVNVEDAEHRLEPDKDSENNPVGEEGFIRFYPARSIPAKSPSGDGILIPCGTYDGAVWVVGYDDLGEPFEKTFDLSIVTFTDNNC